MVNRVTLFGISGRDKFTGLLQIKVSQEDVGFNRQVCRNSYSLTHHEIKRENLAHIFQRKCRNAERLYLLYQGFDEKYFLSIYFQQSLKLKRKLGVSLHPIEQWCNEFDLFALKSDFCVICLLIFHSIL